jgi:cellobiose-specific phosphotransferase system component IIA
MDLVELENARRAWIAEQIDNGQMSVAEGQMKLAEAHREHVEAARLRDAQKQAAKLPASIMMFQAGQNLMNSRR